MGRPEDECQCSLAATIAELFEDETSVRIPADTSANARQSVVQRCRKCRSVARGHFQKLSVFVAVSVGVAHKPRSCIGVCPTSLRYAINLRKECNVILISALLCIIIPQLINLLRSIPA